VDPLPTVAIALAVVYAANVPTIPGRREPRPLCTDWSRLLASGTVTESDSQSTARERAMF
jgi:hypothetical protein